MKLKLKRGTTSKLVRIFVQDTSQTDGSGLTGLVYNSAGLSAYYLREGDSSPTAITLVTATVGTFTSSGFKEVSSSNMPGVYELGLPDAVFATGNSTIVMLRGATNMAPVLLEFELDATDYQDATAFGLSNLDATVSSRGTFDGGSVDSVTGAVGSVTAGVTLASGEHTSIATDVQTGLTAQGYTTLRAAKVDNLDATVSSRSTFAGGAVSSVTGAVGSVTGAVQLDMTQAVPTSNTAQTVGDALNAARAQGFGKWTLVGTTLTLYAANGSTVVRTFTLDSATAPTSRT